MVIINLTEGQFDILINIKYNLKTNLVSPCERTQQRVGDACAWGISRWLNTAFRNGIRIILVAPPSLNSMCDLLTSDLVSMTFFSFLFSFLLYFYVWVFKFSKQYFNFFFLQIRSLLISLLYVLFEITYKIKILFQFDLPLFFLSIILVPVFCIVFLFEIIFLFFLWFYSSLFFPYQIWSLFF